MLIVFAAALNLVSLYSNKPVCPSLRFNLYPIRLWYPGMTFSVIQLVKTSPSDFRADSATKSVVVSSSHALLSGSGMNMLP